jgi:F-type H+-transporting ATPase subunit b
MPQFDFATFPPQLIWLAITFVLLYLLMANIGLPRVGAIVAQRHARIEGDLASAKRLKTESEAVMAAYERAVAEARAEANATIRAAVDRLAAETAERQREVSARLSSQIGAAEARIAEARTAALAGVRDVAIEVALQATARLIGETPDFGPAGAAVDAVLKERV